jgi:hypothetical protein
MAATTETIQQTRPRAISLRWIINAREDLVWFVGIRGIEQSAPRLVRHGVLPLFRWWAAGPPNRRARMSSAHSRAPILIDLMEDAEAPAAGLAFVFRDWGQCWCSPGWASLSFHSPHCGPTTTW